MNIKQGIITILLVCIALITACSSGEQEQQSQSDDSASNEVTLNQVWATGQDELITPECATYHPERNVFYVSNLNRDSDAENGGYISIVNADGTIQNAKWTEGLESPLGNDFHDGSLYVNDRGQIVQIDLESGNITNRIAIEGASNLNGIDIAEDGTIFAADSDGNKIFTVSPEGKAELLYEGEVLNSPNGVHLRGDELIIASSDGSSLLSLDLQSHELSTLVDGGLGHADGIIELDNGQYLISSWNGEVYFIDSDRQVQTILSTSADDINAADIGYIPQDSLLVVPTFYNDRLVGYKLSY